MVGPQGSFLPMASLLIELCSLDDSIFFLQGSGWPELHLVGITLWAPLGSPRLPLQVDYLTLCFQAHLSCTYFPEGSEGFLEGYRQLLLARLQLQVEPLLVFIRELLPVQLFLRLVQHLLLAIPALLHLVT